MPEDQTPQSGPPAEAPPTSNDRPEPPPFRPNKELIGYIERGQKPPARPAASSKTR